MSDIEPNLNIEHFDVFLCHNSEDKAEIRQIADELSRRGLRPWLDEREIPPGTAWQVVLEEQIETIKAAAVFVGRSGFSPWHNAEMRALINEFVERACPVIPVILRSATETPKLPIFLKSLNWVDFRKTESDPIKQLIWGITKKKPNQQTTDISVSDPEILREPVEKNLLSAKAKQIIELRLPGNVDEFSPEQQMTLMQSLSSLLKIGEVKVTRVVAGSIRLYPEADQADADKLYNASKEGWLDELSISDARLYPAIAMPPGQEQRTQLLILLDRVQEYWVDGVLKQSLHHEVLIALGKQAMDEAVEPPWKQVVALPDERRHLLLRDRNINTVFDAMGLLLILGEPGSGKTTSLLELAAALIVRANNDPKERVPIVLNLSSWKKSQTLDEWMAAELSAKYRIPMPIARDWLGKDYLVPLLDGLDEVQTALQPECVAAINVFIDNNKPSGLVVCCRLAEYQWLPERLRLNGAICLEPLSLQDVNKFLTADGAQLVGLQQALKSDSALQELAESPLMLSIMSLACEGVSGETLSTHKDDSPKLRRAEIFRLYVDRMFERKGSGRSEFSKDKSIGWLSWLARKMKEQSQSVFMVEELQPRWLSSTGQWQAYEAVTAMSVGLVGGLCIFLGCQSTSPLKNGVMSGLIGLLIVGPLGLVLVIGLHLILTTEMPGELIDWVIGTGYGGSVLVGTLGGLGIGALNEIHLVETIRWQWRSFGETMYPGLKIGLLIGGVGGVLGGGLIGAVAGALLYGFIFGLCAGFVGGLVDTVTADKVSPNQGIKLSLKNGLGVLVLIGGSITGGLCLISLLLGGDAFYSLFLLWLLIGPSFGLVAGLNRGGSAVVKHYALRSVLWLTGATPSLSRFIPFLDHCAKLILLKKVGGGYMFIHRTLLEYFAGLPSSAHSVQKEKSQGVMS